MTNSSRHDRSSRSVARLLLTPVAFAVLMMGASSSSLGDWTVVNLHPATATSSAGYGIAAGRQVGSARVGSDHASFWTGSTSSWVNLEPPLSAASIANAVSATEQVGLVVISGVNRAALWTDTPVSFVDLHPLSPIVATRSEVNGTDGFQQVGFASIGGQRRAAIWTGTAASFTNIHPLGRLASEAFGIGDGQQVGTTEGGFGPRAALWTGTAASFVDLHPLTVSEFLTSACYDADNGQQVGYAEVSEFHAALWTGTAGSFVDLNPGGSSRSVAYGVHEGTQVGYATFSGVRKAGYWTGTAASWVDLHAFVPTGVTASEARGVWKDSTGTYVIGIGTTIGGSRALLWTLAAECAADFNGVDGVTLQDIFDFLNAWFAGDLLADIDGLNGVDIQDIFDFLNAWFAGC